MCLLNIDVFLPFLGLFAEERALSLRFQGTAQLCLR